jgi:excisionase family DNA binding protein
MADVLRTELTFPPELIEMIADRVSEKLLYLFPNNEPDVIFDVDGVADYLKVTKQWVYDRVHRNAIPHYKLGKYPRFRKTDIDEWLLKMERGNSRKSSKTVRRLLEDTP